MVVLGPARLGIPWEINLAFALGGVLFCGLFPVLGLHNLIAAAHGYFHLARGSYTVTEAALVWHAPCGEAHVPWKAITRIERAEIELLRPRRSGSDRLIHLRGEAPIRRDLPGYETLMPIIYERVLRS